MEFEDSRILRKYLVSIPGTGGEAVKAIPRVCSASMALLRLGTSEDTRDFFRLCFPVLLQRLFGFHESDGAGGWLSLASSPRHKAAAFALIDLLSPPPAGVLFSSLLSVSAAADPLAFTFFFPAERLPDWIQQILLVPNGPSALSQISSPLEKCLVTAPALDPCCGPVQVQLDVFQYYIFWFAYYGTCNQNTNIDIGGSDGASSQKLLSRSFNNWVSGLHRSFQQDLRSSPQNPYLHLLRLYLAYFVPTHAFRKVGGGSSSIIINRVENGTHPDVTQADFLIHTLVAFWLIAGDPSPLPITLCRSHNLPSFSCSNLGHTDTRLELNEALRVLINHWNYSSKAFIIVSDSFRRELSFSFNAISELYSIQYVRLMQRPLYRYILRILYFWASGNHVKKVSQVIDVWLDYLQPWMSSSCISREAADSTIEMQDSESPFVPAHSIYTEKWQGYVISNCLYYTSLVVHFLEFALRFIHSDLDAVLQMTCKVLSIFTVSRELLDLLKKVDASCADPSWRPQGTATRTTTIPQEYVTAIWEQYQDWEDGFIPLLSSTLSPLQQRNCQICLFSSDGCGGAIYALKMLLSQAEANDQLGLDRNQEINKVIELIKDIGQQIFNSCQVGLPHPEAQQTVMPQPQTLTSTIALPKHTWSHVKYRGDWMHRPIESTEIACLARFLVYASDAINKKLGLGLVPDDQVPTSSNVRLPGLASKVSFSADVDMDRSYFKASLIDALNMLSDQLSRIYVFIRRKGWRVNLRVLAQWSYASFLFLFLVIWTLRKVG